jgi:hypothetical protein
MIVGIETDVEEKHGDAWIKAEYSSPLQIVQWTMAAAPNHSAVFSAIELMIHKLKDMSYFEIRKGNPIFLTGPAPWTYAIYETWAKAGIEWKYLRNFGPNPRLIGDMLVLPTSGFA